MKINGTIILLILMMVFSSHIPDNIWEQEYMTEEYITESDTEYTDEQIVVQYFDNINDYKSALLNSYIRRFDNLMALELTAEHAYLNDYSEILALSRYQIPVYLDQIDKITVDAISYNQLTLHSIDALRDDGYDADDIKIGIIDTGVDFTHPWLSYLNSTQKDFSSYYYPAPVDHGTAVVSTMVGKKGTEVLGYAADAEVFSAAMGSETYGSISGDFIGAFEWLIAMGVDVINTSFGGDLSMWQPIVRQLYLNNITLVGSAGNEGDNPFDFNNDPFTIKGPGSSEYAISVGGLSLNGGVIQFSSEGPYYNYLPKPDLLSLGINVNAASTGSSELGQFTGTSFASPLLAGAIAVYISALKANNSYSPAIVKSSMMRNTDPVIDTYYNTVWENEYLIGKGIANMTAVWNDFKNNGANQIELTPSNIPYDYQIHHNRGSRQRLHIWSFVGNITLNYEVTGNISQLLQYTPVNESIQRMDVYVDSDYTDMYGNYTGSLRVYNAYDSDMVNITIMMYSDYKRSILLDQWFTDYDESGINRMTGEIQSTIERLWMDGYYIEENNVLDIDRMNSFDIYWLANLLPQSMFIVGSDYNYKDIDILYEYIDNGGKVLVDLFGNMDGTCGPYSFSCYDSSDKADFFLNDYNIELNKEAISDSAVNTQWQIAIRDDNSIVEYASMQHSGNYISVMDENNPQTTVVAGYDWRTPIITHDVINGGRLAVVTTEELRNERSVNSDNWDIFGELLDWLMDDKFYVSSPVISDNIEGVVYLENDSISVAHYTLDGVQYPLSISSSGNTHNYTIPVIDGEYTFYFETAKGQYLTKELIIDTTAPLIEPLHTVDDSIDIPAVLQFSVTERNIASILAMSWSGFLFDTVYENGVLNVYIEGDIPISNNNQTLLYIKITDISGLFVEFSHLYDLGAVDISSSISREDTSDDGMDTISDTSSDNTPTAIRDNYTEFDITGLLISAALVILVVFVIRRRS